jgi:hypothetical protein
MRLVRNRRLVLAAGAIFFTQLLSASSLRLRAVEGDGMVVSPNAPSPRKITVVAQDDSGKPVGGVTVRFRLPAEGPSGHFASGLSSETVVTPSNGQATVMGILWNDQPGRLLLAVSATLDGETAELEIPVEIGLHAAHEPALANPVHPPSSGVRKKWLILAATVGGAVALGVAASALHGASNPAEPVLQTPLPIASVPPVVGTPTIGISTPGH